MSRDLDRPVTRRTVTRGAAWTAPLVVVGVTVPAYAVSTACVAGTATLTQGTSPTVLSFPPSLVTATVSYSAKNGDGTVRADNTPGETGEVHSTDYSPSWNYLKLHLPKSLVKNQTVTMTLSFTQAVTGLSLTVTDIDGATGSWFDELVVNTLGFTHAGAANVIGTGTSADPFRSIVDGGISSAAGDLLLTWPGSLSQVQLTYRAGITGDSDIGEHIGVGKIGFTC